MMTPETLATVAAAVQVNPAMAALRAQFPDLHFTECSEDDVSPRFSPKLETAGHALFLVSGASGHCLELTNDFNLATGVVIASKVDDQ